MHYFSGKTVSAFGAIHFLFNNAGIPGGLGPIWEQSTEDIQRYYK